MPSSGVGAMKPKAPSSVTLGAIWKETGRLAVAHTQRGSASLRGVKVRT